MSNVITIKPQSGPQEIFLSTPADIAIYGGAAGGGKTWALLMEPLRHVSNKNFGSVAFRRTSPQITNEGGLWDESSKLYPYLDATPNFSFMSWRFPTGAKIRFSHMQHEKNMHDWQGSQIPLILWDELTHFSERQFLYMLSRNRSTSGVIPYMRGTCNPDADSWVAKLIAWWIDQDTGYPIPEHSGVVRYFIRENEALLWAEDKRDLLTSATADDIKSFTFIPASVYDNKELLRVNPSYISNLKALSLVDRERLLGGNWKIRPAAGKVFNRSWFGSPIARDIVPIGGTDVRFWDLASTEKEYAGDNPDYTASVRMRYVNATWYILDVTADRVAPPEVDRMILEFARQDKADCDSSGTKYKVRWEQEPAGSGKRERSRLITLLAGFDADGIRPQGDKITRAKPLAAQTEQNHVRIVNAAWNEMYLQHMHNQPDIDHDDMMDASSGSFNAHTSGNVSYVKIKR